MMYRCMRQDCDEVFPSLLLAKIHVHIDHGIAWKLTRRWLRVVEEHERLPDFDAKKNAPFHPAVLRKSKKSKIAAKSAYKDYLNLRREKSAQTGGGEDEV